MLFSALFLIYRKSISNGVQTQRNFLWNFSWPEDTHRKKEVLERRPRVGTTHQGAPGPPGVAWWVVSTLGCLSGTSSFGCLLAQKNSTKSFTSFGLRLIWIFCKSKTGQKTATGTWHYVNMLVPKNDIKLIGIHSKTSKIDHKTAQNNQKL